MDLEFFNLYNTVQSYKKSIIKNLEKIDEELLQAINTHGHAYGRTISTKKYNVSMAMLNLLQNYTKIIFLSESALEELRLKLDEVSRDSEPERGENSYRFSNPFVLHLFNTEANAEVDTFSIDTKPEITKCTQFLVELEETSDTETLKGSAVEIKEEIEFVEISTEQPVVQAELEVKEEVQLIQASTEPSLVQAGLTVKEEFPLVQASTEPPLVHTRAPDLEIQPQEDILDPLLDEAESDEPQEIPVHLLIEEESDASDTEMPVDSPKTQQPSKSSKPSASKEKYSALTKLLKMNVYDRRKEAEKIYEKNAVKTDFKWKTTSKPPSASPRPKKHKENSVIYEIQDDVLMVDQHCVFSCIENPSEFYVRTNQILFESMESSMNVDLNDQYHYVMGNYKSKEVARAMLGRFCFSFITNKRKWFRVEVLDWMDDTSDSILIRCIDYGEKYLIKYGNLKSMSAFYAEFPKMAIRCHLAAIYPTESDWSQASIDALIELSEMKTMTQFLVIYAYKEGPSYAVDLTKDRNQKTLAEILIDFELACQIEIPTEERKILDVIWEDHEEFDNINEAIAGYDAQDEARICPFTDDTGRCFKGPSCKLEHGRLAEDGITTDKTLTMNQALVEIDLPSVGDNIDIIITGYVNTCHFYAQIITNRTGHNIFNDDFSKLMETINSNNIVQRYEPFKIYPGIGEIVLAKKNLEWCRARCLGYEGEALKIFLVDFGTYSTRKMNELRQIKDDFLYTPFQAVECILDNCCEKSSVKKEASMGFFNNSMLYKNFKALVMGTHEPLRLQLRDANGMDMGYVLKACGLGQHRDSSIFPDKDCILQLA